MNFPLNVVAAFLAMATVLVSAQPAGPNPARPNILFCIADDWSYGDAGAYGNQGLKTPTFDRVAREGALFNVAFCASPSCTPSRAAILTGRAVHQLEEGGNLWGFLPKRFQVYPDLLEQAGYFVGSTRKGWGPGNIQAGGRARNPAGPQFRNFEQFLQAKPVDKAFCFWFGSQDPHRPYERGTGAKSGMKPADVKVPPFWPNTPEVRNDILDYYFEVQRWDRDVGELLGLLEQHGELDNTVVILTSDNGMPFPRAKANLYDAGTRMPLAIRWPKKIKAQQTIDAFVNLQDLAPTILEFAGLKPPSDMVGRSLLPLLTGAASTLKRDMVFLERERHANVRRGDASYPMRAVRTKDFLYIRNLLPQRWPAGDPEMWKAVGPFGDCDAGPTKEFILSKRAEIHFELCFARRPAEELYDLRNDPGQTNNVAGQAIYSDAQKTLRASLDGWMKETSDPRVDPNDDRWDTFPYFGEARRMPEATPAQH